MEKKQEGKLSKTSMVSYILANSTGFQFIQAVAASYVLIFFTDTFGIPAAAASTIMLIASIWDAINDPMMGAIADRTKSRFGRYRIYLLFCPFLLTIVSYLLFLNPTGLSGGTKIVWAGVFYILFGMCVTATQMPMAALLPAMTKKDSERNATVQGMTFVSSVCFLVVSSYTLIMVDVLGGYDKLMLIGGVIMIATFLLLFKNSKEKYVKPMENKAFMHDVKQLLKIKEMYPVMIVWAMGSLGFGIMMAASVYYMMYYICRPDLIPTYMLVMSIAGMASVTFGISILMKIFKGSVKKCFIFSQLFTAAIYVILFFVGGKSMAALYILSALASATATMSNAYIPMILNEMIDFVEYKTGSQMNATVSAIRGFAYKCGSGLSNALLGWTLAATGYVAGAIGQQSEVALMGINIGRFGIPAVAAVILCLALKFYPMNEEVKTGIQNMKMD